jgi:hypothetical protein
MISLVQLLQEICIFEGGNVFGATSSIKKENIQPTLEKFTIELKQIYPKVDFKFSTLGSVGKKDESGDIDLGMSVDQFMTKDGEPLLDSWDIDKVEFDALYEKIRKRTRSATETQSKLRAMLELVGIGIEKKSQFINTDIKAAGSGSIFCTFPQYNENGEAIDDKSVQIDINVGNLDWLNFSYYSNTYKDNVKGLHRTQLMLAMFKALDMMFKHNTGVTLRATGETLATNSQEAINVLNKGFNLSLSQDILHDYFELMNALKKNLSKEKLNQILDIYLKILDSTRADIPFDIQDYWIANQERLGLKGKFLPDNSNLTKYKIV